MKIEENIDLKKIRDLAEQIAKTANVLVVVGIGGAVASKALVRFQNHMGCKPGRPEVIYLDNIDPETHVFLERSLKAIQGGKIDYRRVAFNFISQSGNTVETLGNLELLSSRLIKEGWSDDDFPRNIVVTTNQKSGKLLDWAKKVKALILPFPVPMMGLLGIFGYAGLFPLAVTGGDIDLFINGCIRARNSVMRDSKDSGSHAIQIARAFYLLDQLKGKDLHGFFLYSDALKSAGEWLEQLWAEGLGKSDTVGPRPLVMIGTTAQHSVNQDNIAGRNDKAILFIGAQELRSDYVMLGESVDYLKGNTMSHLLLACLKGTLEALTKRNRPNMTYLFPKLTLEYLGEFLMTMAFALHIAGRLYGVDPYQQLAVESGKDRLRKSFLD